METYTRQGGTSAIFVHDDGLRTLDTANRDKRIAFYADHNIGWVARPPHSDDAGGYKRSGRFRKGSNMNYGLALTMCMEKNIEMLKGSGYNGAAPLEEYALELAIEETYQNTGKRWKPWAKNARSLRVGDIVLIVDADTIVPEDCFRDAAREFAECPEVAIIQHESDVMKVAHHFFENGLAYFTRRMNKCISLACANGEMAPFIGHNAFLRWSAIQDAAFVDPVDGIKKVWSETRVSEDFELALRVLLKDYTIRWANYSKGRFKEGVSLTVDDELNRWKKITFGCNELMFNPIKDWWYLGPITKQLRIFLLSNAPSHYKISMLAYMSSYYGIATSPFLSLLNYLVWGWSFDPVTVVFTAASNVSYTLLEYRLGQCDILSALSENLSFVPFLWFFFSGLSVHLWYALLAHLLSFDITWSATKKEVEMSNFWREGPRIIRQYWVVFLTSTIALTAIVLPSTPLVHATWRIEPSWAVLPPLITVAAGHILVPFVLNPWFMIFSCR
ncbi:hypothetical protein HYPSUDRAFT_48741 [Hypholoma sublateritium FD-334 SS-4]|uniref:Glycosyltransferase 2-like domain-containing protein n=1 Tax=Hypholoma sublateritium (strain FD-334 SS-4) TaxID=945553 RepID=A0A0D2LVP1_HYPSF|nr:hypothetical protein HYPSUDRAFT_48741 [Hypholoma sublateritium FD-334 SS-4]